MNTITQKTKLIALIGYPLVHSFSPLMHNAAFNSLSLNYVYLALPVPPGQLSLAVKGIRAFRIMGNVTIPHKEDIVPFLDYFTDEAEIVGAVNTFYWRENKLIGDNTDIQGFAETLSAYKIDMLGRTATIIGSGGAARAVAAAIAQAGAKEIIVYSRKLENVLKVTNDMSLVFPDTIWVPHATQTTIFTDDLSRSHLLVNASPVGMFPNPQYSPLDEGFFKVLLSDSHVYDLVYNPIETTFLKMAKKKGLKTYSGLELLVRQGSISFKRWTEQDAPREIMATVLRKHIEQFIAKEQKMKTFDKGG